MADQHNLGNIGVVIVFSPIDLAFKHGVDQGRKLQRTGVLGQIEGTRFVVVRIGVVTNVHRLVELFGKTMAAETDVQGRMCCAFRIQCNRFKKWGQVQEVIGDILEGFLREISYEFLEFFFFF